MTLNAESEKSLPSQDSEPPLSPGLSTEHLQGRGRCGVKISEMHLLARPKQHISLSTSSCLFPPRPAGGAAGCAHGQWTARCSWSASDPAARVLSGQPPDPQRQCGGEVALRGGFSHNFYFFFLILVMLVFLFGATIGRPTHMACFSTSTIIREIAFSLLSFSCQSSI